MTESKNETTTAKTGTAKSSKKSRKFTTSINGKVYVTEADNAVEAGEKARKLHKEIK